jgi:hypothetical protein
MSVRSGRKVYVFGASAFARIVGENLNDGLGFENATFAGYTVNASYIKDGDPVVPFEDLADAAA